jgi:hypothetical protein
MKDGRSKAPPLPEFLRDEMEARVINNMLGTSYSMAELAEMPELWLEKMLMWANAD